MFNRDRRDAAADISGLLGQNLRAARKTRGYSLQALAGRSGVSRAMLGQIETGKSVPTVTVVCRIAAALEIPIHALIASGVATQPVIVRSGSAPPTGGEGLRTIAAPGRDEEPRFFEISLAPARSCDFPAAVQLSASLIVVRGRLQIDLGGPDAIEVADGDATFFDAARPFRVANVGAEPALAYLLLAPGRAF